MISENADDFGSNDSVIVTAESLYDRVLKKIESNELNLPPDWKVFTKDHNKKGAFSICKFFTNAKNEPIATNITVLLEKSGYYKFKVCGTNLNENHNFNISLSQAADCDSLLALIKEIDESYNVCKGSAKDFQVCRNIECQLLMPGKGRFLRCGHCSKEKKRIFQKQKYEEERNRWAKKKSQSTRLQMNKLKSLVNINLLFFM